MYDGHFKTNPKRDAVREPFPLGRRRQKYLLASVTATVETNDLIFATREEFAATPLESLAQAPEACRKEIRASWCHVASSEA